MSRCPQCGERIQIESSSRCPHCRAPLREHGRGDRQARRRVAGGRSSSARLLVLWVCIFAAGLGVYFSLSGRRRSKRSTAPASAPTASSAAASSAARKDKDLFTLAGAPDRFQPVAFLPEATRLAQNTAFDARLVRIDASPIFGDGRVDLRQPNARVVYRYRSAAESTKPADVPCDLDVTIGKDGATVAAVHSDSGLCDDAFVPDPNCDPSHVWQKALDQGGGRDPGSLRYAAPAKWIVTSGGSSVEIPDDCAPAAVKLHVVVGSITGASGKQNKMLTKYLRTLGDCARKPAKAQLEVTVDSAGAVTLTANGGDSTLVACAQERAHGWKLPTGGSTIHVALSLEP
jgi:hypothetical protein